MKRGKFIIIILVSLVLVSCGLELMEEGENVNDYIYPYLVFTPEENGDGVTVTVVDGAELEEIYIPSTVEVGGVTVPVTSFNGFENPEDAKNLKTVTLGSNDTSIAEDALEKATNLETREMPRTAFCPYCSFVQDRKVNGGKRDRMDTL